jgi:hypothetical protein
VLPFYQLCALLFNTNFASAVIFIATFLTRLLGPLSPRSRFSQSEMRVKHGASAGAQSSRCRVPSLSQLATAAPAQSSGPAVRPHQTKHRHDAGAAVSAAAADHTDVVQDDDDCRLEESDDSGAADDADDLGRAQSSSAKGRPAKQTARTLITIATKSPRVKGFKSPKLAQYKSKKQDTRKWDPVIRKYIDVSKLPSATASDQPPPPPRSHKKAPAANRPGVSPAIVASVSTVSVLSEPRAERASTRSTVVTPKVILFDDKAAAAVSEASAVVAEVVPVIAATAAPAASAVVPAPPRKSDKPLKKVSAPSARAVEIMPKIILFDGEDEEAGRQQLEDSTAPAMSACAQQQHSSFPNNTECVRSKPSSLSTPHKRSRSSLTSTPAPAPIISPRKRGQHASPPVAISCLPAVPQPSFQDEIKSIVAAEVSADPRSEAKMKAVARFLLGGVVERAELADKSVHSCL